MLTEDERAPTAPSSYLSQKKKKEEEEGQWSSLPAAQEVHRGRKEKRQDARLAPRRREKKRITLHNSAERGERGLLALSAQHPGRKEIAETSAPHRERKKSASSLFEEPSERLPLRVTIRGEPNAFGIEEGGASYE